MDVLSEVFSLLSNERRRYALYYLDRADGPVRIDELAEAVSAWERDPAKSDLPEETYEVVVLTLEHSHVPKAAEAEYVDYDPTSNSVEISGSPPGIYSHSPRGRSDRTSNPAGHHPPRVMGCDTSLRQENTQPSGHVDV